MPYAGQIWSKEGGHAMWLTYLYVYFDIKGENRDLRRCLPRLTCATFRVNCLRDEIGAAEIGSPHVALQGWTDDLNHKNNRK